MKDFICGAQLYSVRGTMQTEADIRATFAAIRGMGYTTCQLSGQNRDIPNEAIADLLAEADLKCVVTHNPMEDFTEHLDELIARHKKWNCRYAGIGAMPGEFHEDAEGYRRFCRIMRGIAPKLKDNGITFVYHNHAFEFTRYDGVLAMDILLEEFGDNMQFLPDLYWIQAGGCDPVSWIYKLDGRADIVHLKDMAGTGGFNPHCTMVPVGSGNLDWPRIKEALENTHVKYAEVEQDNAADKPDPLGEMRASAEYLRRMGFKL